MTYTGHKQPTMASGESLVDYIKRTLIQECEYYKVPMPTDEQIAVVLLSARMHTVIMRASDYDTSELGKPNEVTAFWPMQSSIGRFFRDAAQVTLDRRIK